MMSCGYALWLRPSGASLIYHSASWAGSYFSRSGAAGWNERGALPQQFCNGCAVYTPPAVLERPLPQHLEPLYLCIEIVLIVTLLTCICPFGLHFFFVCLITSSGRYFLKWSFVCLLLRNVYSSYLPVLVQSPAFVHSVLWVSCISYIFYYVSCVLSTLGVSRKQSLDTVLT